MVASRRVAVFAHRRAAEFAAPDDERFVEQAARFEVLHQRGLAPVHFATHLLEIALEIFARSAVAVPVGVIELNKPDSPFDQAAREQAIPGERRFARFDAIEIERGLAFAGQVDEFGRARLHPIGHLVGRDAGVDLGVARLDRPAEVEIADGIDGPALAVGADVFGGGQVQDRFAAASEGHALKTRRQEAAAPIDRAAARPARTALEHDEAGQIIALAADAVGGPRPHAWPAELAAAGVHEQLCGGVIEQVRGARFHERDVVHDRRGVREEFTHPRAGPAVLFELAPSAEEVGAMTAAHEREAFPFDKRLGNRLAVQFGEFRLVIEQLELARASGHEQINDAPGARLEMGRVWRHRIGRCTGRGAQQLFVAEKGRQRDAAQAHRAAPEEMAARERLQGFRRWEEVHQIDNDE